MLKFTSSADIWAAIVKKGEFASGQEMFLNNHIWDHFSWHWIVMIHEREAQKRNDDGGDEEEHVKKGW